MSSPVRSHEVWAPGRDLIMERKTKKDPEMSEYTQKTMKVAAGAQLPVLIKRKMYFSGNMSFYISNRNVFEQSTTFFELVSLCPETKSQENDALSPQYIPAL